MAIEYFILVCFWFLGVMPFFMNLIDLRGGTSYEDTYTLYVEVGMFTTFWVTVFIAVFYSIIWAVVEVLS